MSEKLTPLQALENIVVDLSVHLIDANKEEIKLVETTLKAFEIIKERRLDVNELIGLVHHKDKYLLLDEYNEYVFANPITKEELDLFSEVL